MGELKNVFIMGLMSILAIAGISCVGGVKPNQADTEEHQIRQVLNNFIEAYETRNIDLLRQSLWEESSFYPELVERAKRDFARYSTISIEFSEINITLYNEGKRAIVTLKERFRAEIGQEVKYIETGGIIELIKPEYKWLIVSLYRDIWMREIPQEP